MADEFSQFGGYTATADDEFAEFGGMDEFSQFGGQVDKGPPVVNEQHPDLGWWQRTKIKNFAADPMASARYLKTLGFEVSMAPEGDELVIRKPGEPEWRKIEKHGLEWSDITDIPTDITAGAAMGVGAVLGGGSSFGAGTVAGAAGGAAAHEAGRRGVGRLLGMGAESIEEDIGGVLEEGVYGAAGELLLGGGSKLIKGGVRKIRGKPRMPPAALPKDLPPAVEAVVPGVGKQVGKMEGLSLPSAAGREVVLPGVERQVARATTMPKDVPIPTEPIVKKLTPRQRALKKQAQVRKAAQVKIGKMKKAGRKKRLQELRKEFKQKPTELAPELKPPAEAVPVGKQAAETHMREAIERSSLPKKGQQFLTAEQATDKWKAAEALWKKKNPGQKLPRFVTEQKPKPARYKFTMKEKEMGKLFKSMSDPTLRQTLHNAGYKEAWETAGEEGAKRYVLDRVGLEGLATKDTARFVDHLAAHRADVFELVNKASKAQKAMELHFIKRNGDIRRGIFASNAPASAAGPAREVVAQWAEGVPDSVLKKVARGLRAKDGKKKALRRLTESGERKAVEDMGRNELLYDIWNSHKTSFTTGLKYDPKVFGNRIMWDMEKRNWRSLPMDGIVRMRAAGGEAMDFVGRQAGAQGTRRAMANLFRTGGKLAQKPAEKVFGLTEKVVGKELAPAVKMGRKYLPAVGATGVAGPVAQTLGVLDVAGKGMVGISRYLARKRTAPPSVRTLLEKVERKTKTAGEAAASALLYTLMRKHPELRKWLEGQGGE